MAVYSADAVQTVNPGEAVVFTNTIVPCTRNFVRHRDGTGIFMLSGAVNCRCKQFATYKVDFGANIAASESADPVSVGIAIDGTTVPASEMIVTPAATGNYFNVSREIAVDIWAGCCESVSVRNLSNQPITVQNATINISR